MLRISILLEREKDTNSGFLVLEGELRIQKARHRHLEESTAGWRPVSNGPRIRDGVKCLGEGVDSTAIDCNVD